MLVCRHCGTPVKLVTPEDRPYDSCLWGAWIHAKIAPRYNDIPEELELLPNHGCYFGCHYYLDDCYEHAKPMLCYSEEYAEKFEETEEGEEA